MNRRIIIIGTGIGGLSTAYLLAKQGDHVILLEHDKRPGGCLQSFYREGIRFDTGFHFVGGMAEGGPLHRFFRDLDLLDLPWQELDCQEIWIGNRCFRLPTGHDRWMEYMTSQFPHQTANLHHFVDVLKQVVECPFSQTMPYWEKNAWEWLCETIDDPLLRDVLSGSSLIIELNRQTLPLFAYAEIIYSYIYSSHRLEDGGQPIIDHFTSRIQQMGGEIHCSSTVTRIIEVEGQVRGVELQDGTVIEADIVVSAIHPALTMNMLGDDTSMRKIYRRRIANMKDSRGCFTANIKLKPGSLTLKEQPLYVHREGSDFWDYSIPPFTHLLIHCYPNQNAIDIITPLPWSEVERWKGTTVGHRGVDYECLKQELLDQTLDLAQVAMPGLREAMDQVWTSTPLTWHDYFCAHNGTAYGICKDCNSPESTLLLPRTPLQGLYLAGQAIILHGIMGTVISSFIAAEFLKQN